MVCIPLFYNEYVLDRSFAVPLYMSLTFLNFMKNTSASCWK